MTLNVEISTRSAIATIRGRAGKLDRVESNLWDWARQIGRAARQNKAQPVWVRRGPLQLDVLLGAALGAGLVPANPEHRLSNPDGPLEADQQQHMAKLQASGYLRPYQAEAVRAAIEAPYGRGIIDAPMGSGKTRICHAIAQVVGGSWVYLVANQQLALQTADGAPKNLQCFSYGTVPDSALQSCVGLLADECHRVSANSYSRVPLRSRAAWRIGLSGTPLLRQDSRNPLVVGLLGPLIFYINKKILEKGGYLARGSVKNLRVN